MRRALLALFVTLGCQGTIPGKVPQGVVVQAPTYEERLTAAMDSVGSARISLEAGKVLADVEGKVRVDVPGKLTGVPGDIKPLALFEDSSLKQALVGQDESVVVQKLLEDGVEVLILHSEMAPSIDRGGKVLSRLYHHDALSQLALFRVGDGLLYYQVRDKPIAFPPQLAMLGVQYLRRRMAGETLGRLPDLPSETGVWDLVASIRGQGRELAVALARDKSFQGALEELYDDLETSHRRSVEWHGFPRLSEHAADLTIELHRITERAFVEPREERELEDLWEMGIDGAYVITANKKERGVLPGAVSYTQAIRTADSFLRKAAQLGRMSERRPWRDRDAWLEMFRTIHYQEIPGKGLSLLYRGVPPVPLQMVNIETTRQSIVKAGEWYLANLQPDGQVIYKFWPAENRYSNEYNHVRHTLATWNLVQAWHMEPRPEFLEGARRALDWTLKYRVDEGEMSYFSYNDNQKLGSVVVGLLGMVDLAKATDDHQWDELMKRMGKFVLFMQEESGTFRGYHVEKGHPYFGEKNDIVPGEAALSLIYLADYFDDDSWIETLPQYWSYYRPWFEERVSRQRDGAPWPAFTYTNDDRLELVQFGPWTVMAANAYYRRKPDLEVADFALEIARWMIDSYQWTEERTPFPDYVGGYYKLPGELPAMQAFCYAEGTAAAYQLALKARPEQAPFFEKSTREAVRFGIQMQFDEHSTYPFSRPEQVDGGIRYAMNETKVRIDYVHHALSAMYLYYQGALEDPNLPASVAVRSAPGDAPGTDAEGSAEEPSDLASVPESAAAE